MRFEASQNNSYENVESRRQDGVWTDHTTQVNRYDDLLEAIGERSNYDGDLELDILDVGCSTGEAANYFAEELEDRYGVTVNVVGVDIGDEVVDEAGQVLDEAYQGKAQNLDFETDRFDIVTSKTLLSRIGPEDQTDAMNEINRVVDDDGYAAVEVDPEGEDRVFKGTSYVMTGEEMTEVSQETEGFSDYSIAEELEPYKAVDFHQEKEKPDDVEKHNEGEFLGTTRHVAEQAGQEQEGSGDDDIIVA